VQFEGTDGSTVELNVTGYQFPAGLDLPSGRHVVPDWLNVESRVTTQTRAWSWTFPCLYPDEAVQLGVWLNNVLLETGTDARIGFTEPNLTIDLLKVGEATATLRFRFAQEACPPDQSDDVRLGDGFPVDITCSLEALATAVRNWEQEITPFPARG